jgi:hypothetical protein
MTLFDQAAAVMDLRLRAFYGEEVTYIRGTTTADLTTMVGASVHEVDSGFAIPEKVTSVDFLVAAADLTAAGLGVPAAGDRIHRVMGGQTHIYESAPIGKEPAARPADPTANTYRIHTRHIAVT